MRFLLVNNGHQRGVGGKAVREVGGLIVIPFLLHPLLTATYSYQTQGVKNGKKTEK